MGVVAAACSTHPLPADIIDLPISQLVHQIQCEGAHSVYAEAQRRGIVAAAAGLKETAAEVATAAENLKTAQAGLKDGRNDFGTSKAALESAFDSIDLQIEQVLHKIDRLELEKGNPHSEGLLKTLKLELRQLYRQYRYVVTVGNLYVQVDKVNKELKRREAKLGSYKDVIAFEGNNAVFQFIFQVTENNNATSRGTITWPIVPGVITLGYDVGDKRKRASDRQVRILSSFRELLHLDCRNIDIADEHRFPRMYPITGEIGLAEVLGDYLRVSDLKGQKFHLGGASDSYRDKITFTTAINGSIKPGINLSKRIGQLIDVSADLTADRMDVHEVTIFLTPPGATPGASAPGIIIQEMPPVRVRARLVEQSPAG